MSDRFLILEIEEGRLEGELHLNNLFLHCVLKDDIKFTKSMYKTFLSVWLEVVEELKARDVHEVFSFVTTKSDKINKWQVMFGMQPLLKTESHILYRRIL